MTTSDWIKHVKTYADEHKVSYKDALKSSRATYKYKQNGGIIKSNFADKMVATKDGLDVSKTNKPSPVLKFKKIEPVEEPIIKKKRGRPLKQQATQESN